MNLQEVASLSKACVTQRAGDKPCGNSEALWASQVVRCLRYTETSIPPTYFFSGMRHSFPQLLKVLITDYSKLIILIGIESNSLPKVMTDTHDCTLQL